MNKIVMKTFELIDVLDSSDLIRNLSMYKERISNNSDLCDLINKGNNTSDKYLLLDIKRKLYNNLDYKGYIDSYNELMYIVMKINSKYRELLEVGGCFK